jgi:hypothetical protein
MGQIGTAVPQDGWFEREPGEAEWRVAQPVFGINVPR